MRRNANMGKQLKMIVFAHYNFGGKLE